MNGRAFHRLLLGGAKGCGALLLVVGLFVLGVMLAPPAEPDQRVFAQPQASTAQPESASGGGAFSGTLASFTALIPEPILVYLPVTVR